MSDFPGFKPLEANFTMTPNQFFDRIVGRYHPCVVTVVAILIRSTLGWKDADTGQRRTEAELPLSKFVRPEMSESSARKGIAGAIEAGFMVQTAKATNRSPARYALRWDDDGRQGRAVEKERRAAGGLQRKGVPVMPPKWGRGVPVAPLAPTPLADTGQGVTGQGVTGQESAPPIYKGVLKKSSLRKKSKLSEKKQKPESFSPSVLEEQEKDRPNVTPAPIEGKHTKTPSETPLESALGDAATAALNNLSASLFPEAEEEPETTYPRAVNRAGAAKLLEAIEKAKKGGAT